MSDRGWKFVGWVVVPSLLWIGTGYAAYQPGKALVREARLVARAAKSDIKDTAHQVKWHIRATQGAARIMMREAQQRLES